MMREAAAAACGLFVVLHLLGEERDVEWLRAGGKLAASSAFLVFALASGGADAGLAGRLVLAALALSFVGDAFLLGHRKPLFLAGLGFFLLAHLAYVGAFAALGPSTMGLLAALPVVVAIAVASGRWLAPHVGPMRPAVFGYVAAISAMLAFAVAAAAGAGPRAPRIVMALGAAAFAASDLLVARERFVSRTPWNHRVALPLYYAAQLAFGGCVAAAAG